VIDFTDPRLNLIYLVQARYHDGIGEKKVNWCGPPERTGGGGVTVQDPATGAWTLWESRLSRCTLNHDLGGLGEALTRTGSISFKVQIGGPDSADLRVAVRDGRWLNRPAVVWLYDLSTGNSQHVGDGVVSREPAAWNDRDVAIDLTVWPFPETLKWPMAVLPSETPGDWVASVTAGVVETWHPELPLLGQYVMNPAHYGKHWGPLFGGLDGQAVYDPEGLFSELVPYGLFDVSNNGGFLWVSPIEGCFVSDIWIEGDDGVKNLATTGARYLRNFVNRDPTRGPLGSCVKVGWPTFTASQRPRWWGESNIPSGLAEGAGHRIVGRVAGPGWADFPATFDEVTDPFLNHGWGRLPDLVDPTSTDVSRRRYDRVLADLDAHPFLNAFGAFLGANALSDFVTDEPSALQKQFQCRVPYALSDEPPPMRAVLAELMAILQADLCWRFDAVSDRMAMFPIWRGPRPGAVPKWTFTARDLVSVEPPRSLQWVEDPWRDYCTRVTIKSPQFAYHPTLTATELLTQETAEYVNPVEEAADQYNGELLKTITRRYWSNTGPTGLSADYVGRHHTQRQRASIGVLGREGFLVQLGDLIAYNVDDYPASVGQVRRVTLNLDAVTATITALHIQTFDAVGDGRNRETEK
jgi:hypothetical protein